MFSFLSFFVFIHLNPNFLSLVPLCKFSCTFFSLVTQQEVFFHLARQERITIFIYFVIPISFIQHSGIFPPSVLEGFSTQFVVLLSDPFCTFSAPPHCYISDPCWAEYKYICESGPMILNTPQYSKVTSKSSSNIAMNRENQYKLLI